MTGIARTLVVLGALIRSSGGGVRPVVVAGVSGFWTTWLLANNHMRSPGSTVCLSDGCYQMEVVRVIV